MIGKVVGVPQGVVVWRKRFEAGTTIGPFFVTRSPGTDGNAEVCAGGCHILLAFLLSGFPTEIYYAIAIFFDAIRKMAPRLGNSTKLKSEIPPRTILTLALQAPTPTQRSLRTPWHTEFRHKSTCPDAINFKALCGTHWVLSTPESGLNENLRISPSGCHDLFVGIFAEVCQFSTLYIEPVRRF